MISLYFFPPVLFPVKLLFVLFQFERRRLDPVLNSETSKPAVQAALTCENNITSALDVCLWALKVVHVLV